MVVRGHRLGLPEYERNESDTNVQSRPTRGTVWQVLRNAWAAQVASGLQGLRPIDRDAVALVYFERCSYADAAARLGVTYSTVAKAVRRGLQAVAFAVEFGAALDQGTAV